MSMSTVWPTSQATVTPDTATQRHSPMPVFSDHRRIMKASKLTGLAIPLSYPRPMLRVCTLISLTAKTSRPARVCTNHTELSIRDLRLLLLLRLSALVLHSRRPHLSAQAPLFPMLPSSIIPPSGPTPMTSVALAPTHAFRFPLPSQIASDLTHLILTRACTSL